MWGRLGNILETCVLEDRRDFKLSVRCWLLPGFPYGLFILIEKYTLNIELFGCVCSVIVRILDCELRIAWRYLTGSLLHCRGDTFVVLLLWSRRSERNC